MLLFFRPNSKLARHVLAYADQARTTYAGQAHVVVLAVGSEAGALVQMRSQLRVKSPVRDGTAAVRLFAGDCTPRTVILDPTGKVHLIAPGWGGEYPEWFGKELAKLCQP